MADLEYVQLVVLTERPGARIGRMPAAALTSEERAVADGLELVRRLQAAFQADRQNPMLWLLREQSTDDWKAATATLRLLDRDWLAGRIRRVVRLAGLHADDHAHARAARLDALPDRLKDVIGRVGWSLVLAELHAPLMRFVRRYADAIPGVHELPSDPT